MIKILYMWVLTFFLFSCDVDSTKFMNILDEHNIRYMKPENYSPIEVVNNDNEIKWFWCKNLKFNLIL